MRIELTMMNECIGEQRATLPIGDLEHLVVVLTPATCHHRRFACESLSELTSMNAIRSDRSRLHVLRVRALTGSNTEMKTS